MSEVRSRLTIKVANERPLDLFDLTTLLAALADEYRRYTGDEQARLYVDRITEGSVVAELVSMGRDVLQAGRPLIPLALDMIAPFLGHWSGLLTGLANYGRDAAKDADLRRTEKPSIRNAKNFVQPALNGNPINILGDATVNQYNINISPQRAGDIARNATHLLAGPLPDERRFENEPLALYQVRDAPAGDMGYIDRFDIRPRRLTFAGEAVKHAILHAEAPFDVFFYVSGVVKTAGGEVASYHIEQINSSLAKDAA